MSLQQHIARTERRRLTHKLIHGCEGGCAEGLYLNACVAAMERCIDQGKVPRVVPTGTLGEVRLKIKRALVRDEIAKRDPLIFALLAYEVLTPGEIALLEAFDAFDGAAAVQWARALLQEAGAEFEFVA